MTGFIITAYEKLKFLIATLIGYTTLTTLLLLIQIANITYFIKVLLIIGVICIEHLNNTEITFRIVAIDSNLKNLGYGTHLIRQAEDIVRTRNCKKYFFMLT